MKRVTLVFKKEDFENPYMDSDSCAITQALYRAGLISCVDSGVSIDDKTTRKNLTTEDREDYQNLVDKVLGMYSTRDNKIYSSNKGRVTPLPIEDFEFTIELDIEEENV